MSQGNGLEYRVRNTRTKVFTVPGGTVFAVSAWRQVRGLETTSSREVFPLLGIKTRVLSCGYGQPTIRPIQSVSASQRFIRRRRLAAGHRFARDLGSAC